jgi:hypothetical protein
LRYALRERQILQNDARRVEYGDVVRSPLEARLAGQKSPRSDAGMVSRPLGIDVEGDSSNARK